MFQQLLEDALQQVDGALACGLMGFDGIPVETALGDRSRVDAPTLGTELSGHILGLARTMDALRIGPMGELSLQTARLWVVARVLNQNYFLLMFLEPGANLGKARYLLRMLAPKIRREF